MFINLDKRFAMDNPVRSVAIRLGNVTNVTQIEELGHTIIAQDVLLNGKVRNVIVIMDTADYKKLQSQGGKILLNKINEIVEENFSYLTSSFDAKEKKLNPEKISAEPYVIKQLDEEIDNIQELMSGIEEERKKIDMNELEIIELFKRLPGSTTEELNALKKQTQESHKFLNERSEKLEEYQATLLAHRQELRKEIVGLIKTAEKADLKRPGTLNPKVKPAPPKHGVEKIFALFKKDPKKIESFKEEFNLIPKEQREKALTNLYRDTLKQVKGNQSHKEYKAFEEFCYALQQPMVTLVLTDKTFTLPKIICEEYDYFKVKLEGKFLNFGMDIRGNKIIKLEEIAPEIQSVFARAIMYGTADRIINAGNVSNLLRTGDELGINWLIRECEKFLISNLDKEKCRRHCCRTCREISTS